MVGVREATKSAISVDRWVKGIQWWTIAWPQGHEALLAWLDVLPWQPSAVVTFLVALKEAPSKLGQQNRWPKLLSRVRDAICDNGHKHILRAWLEGRDIFMSGLFSQWLQTNYPDNLSSILRFSEIGAKATEEPESLPERRSDLVFRRSLRCWCPVNRVVLSRPLGKVRCRSTTSKVLHMHPTWIYLLKKQDPFDESTITLFPKEGQW